MTQNDNTGKKSGLSRWIMIGTGGVVCLGVLAFAYVSFAFPKTRCEAVKHLESPEAVSDCYECHLKSTPKVAQDWMESKHGVMLVKCFVCHGQHDGKGSVPWAVNPDVDATCRKCHDPSIKKMQEKYGVEQNCSECHPYHNNSLHHKAYEKTKAKKTID